MEERFIALIKKTFGIDNPDLQKCWVDYYLSSLEAVELLVYMEEEFGHEPNFNYKKVEELLVHKKTFGEILKTLE